MGGKEGSPPVAWLKGIKQAPTAVPGLCVSVLSQG